MERVFISCLVIATKLLRKAVKPFSVKQSLRIHYKLVEHIAKKCISKSGEYLCITCWEPKSCWRKSCFAETVNLSFEGMSVPAPSGYDEVLRETYGDYMKLPPEDQRKPHKVFQAVKL